MTISPSDMFAVTPIAEYEPPRLPLSVTTVNVAARRSHTGRPPAQLPAQRAVVLSPSMRQAAAFADAALRRALEVIDRRRPLTQLRPLLAASLADSVVSVGRPGQAGAAVLRRMRLQPVGDPATAAEVFGCYSRGDRIHAIACRVEQTPGDRWLVVALHIG